MENQRIDGEAGGAQRPSKDGKWPAYQHYPGDFERDLAANSLAAQGLWIRMLGWMHQNEAHRGFLELPNGQPMTDKQIALRVGRSVREVRPLIEELKNFGVFSVTPSGALYCRRMARETYISEVRRAAAKSRAYKAARAADGAFVEDVAGIVGGEFAPAKLPANGEQNTVLSSSFFTFNKHKCAPNSAETSMRMPWTREIASADRAYLTEYIAAFHNANQRWPDPEDCPIRFTDTVRGDGGRVVSMEAAEWVLGVMPFRRPSTWGMVHVYPPDYIEQLNAVLSPIPEAR